MVLLAQIQKIGIRHGHLVPLTVFFPDLHKLFRMIVRQRPQQHAIHNAEDGGGGADAKRKSEDRNQAETGVPEQHANAIAQILK